MTTKPAGAAQEGLSLIELMVAITISLLMSLAIFSALSGSEGRKRTITSINDLNQVGTFATYTLDKILRSAGSGFTQNAEFTYGCPLRASLASAGTILPFLGEMPPPFAAMNTTLGGNYRLAPVMIAKDATTPNISAAGLASARSDVLIVMAGSAGLGEVSTLFIAPATASKITLQNTVSFQKDDMILVSDTPGPAGPKPCMIQQIAPTFNSAVTPGALALAGDYWANPIAGSDLTTYSTLANVLSLGSATSGNPPAFSLYGVGDNNTMFAYDLLQMGAYNVTQEVADGIFEMHALYGVDADGDGRVDRWADPGTDAYTITKLQSGTSASVATLRSIKAIRLGLILRTSLPEKVTTPPATSGPLTLFSDLGASFTYSRPLAASEQNFRYRVIETTVPLRNPLLLE